ncbi:MAG: hypothetical protein JNJ78_15915 [Anaerolineae bacterium]|nr:hypothetical protein [Anaerolineae bacterium]
MKELPHFKPRDREQVEALLREVLTLGSAVEQSHLIEVIAYPDGHYRALFAPAYFVLPAGKSEPSKSQWSNLKKRLKRHDPLVFVYKEHGESTQGEQKRRVYYLDFGFFAS